jgi:hypothetical protein
MELINSKVIYLKKYPLKDSISLHKKINLSHDSNSDQKERTLINFQMNKNYKDKFKNDCCANKNF